ncbi:MAG TPA: FtsQ-type POTRA domain-containing protein [Ignavibacteria bacterium]|nr:FtsQ-type POTRA domain-containing protein [Ignavibacteria bacterium]
MKKKNIFIFIVLTLISVSAVVVFANKWRNNVNYEKITITGNYNIPDSDIFEVARLKKDSVINIEEVNINIIQDRLSKHPEIKKVYVSKEPPAELRIEIIEKRPIATINTGTDLKLIDDELEIFPYKNLDKLYDLPIISGIKIDDNLKVFNNVNKTELKSALKVIVNAYTFSKPFYYNISEVNLSDSSKIIIYTNDNSVPFYIPTKSLMKMNDAEFNNLVEDKVKMMDEFYKTVLLKNLDKEIEYVDFRFSNQVVVKYKNQINGKEKS